MWHLDDRLLFAGRPDRIPDFEILDPNDVVEVEDVNARHRSVFVDEVRVKAGDVARLAWDKF